MATIGKRWVMEYLVEYCTQCNCNLDIVGAVIDATNF